MNDLQRILELSDNLKKIIEHCPTLTFIGDGVLRTRTQHTTFEEGVSIGNELIVVLKKIRSITGFGRGLAAPQIGISKSVFVTYVNDEFKTYTNPKLMSESDKHNYYKEGCLSCGFTWADVRRPVSIVLEYMNENGNMSTEEADGFLARLLQHEYDHLQGIVNLDKAEPSSIEFMLSDPLQEELRE